MRPEEKIDLVRKVRELAPKDKLILAGSGCEGKKITKDKFWLEVLASKGIINLANLSVFILPIHLALCINVIYIC